MSIDLSTASTGRDTVLDGLADLMLPFVNTALPPHNGSISAVISATVANTVVYLQPTTYTATSLISVALSDVTFIGVPGATKITGSFGYAVIQLLACSNVTFYGVEFESTYVNSVEDNSKSVVYGQQANWLNLVFHRCTFTVPNANTNGLGLFARTSAADTSGSIDGLIVEDCDFHDCGRMGIILMNRYTGAGTEDFTKRIKINRNKFRNLGLSGDYGQAVSLDGAGRVEQMNHNELSECHRVGLESVGWNGGECIGNTFKGFTLRSGETVTWAPMGWANDNGRTNNNWSIKNNRCLEAGPNWSYFIGMRDSSFENNYFWMEGTDSAAFHLRDALRCTFTKDYYKSNYTVAALIGNTSTTTADCTWYECVADTAGGASVFSSLRFDGTNTTKCRWVGGNLLKGTGGVYSDSTNSARYKLERVAIAGVLADEYTAIALPDANYTTFEWVVQSGSLRFTGTLTAGRTVTFPLTPRRYLVWNDTAQILTLSANSTTVTVAAGAKRIVSYQTTNNAWTDWGALA